MDDLIIKDRVFVIRLFITRNILSQYNSIFKEVHGTISGGFRLYNQFCFFVYSQLQAIFSTTHLENVADWDNYLSFNMDDETLPYKTVDEFLLDRDLSNLSNDSKIPTPRRFIAQVISFYRCFSKILLASEMATLHFPEDYHHSMKLWCWAVVKSILWTLSISYVDISSNRKGLRLTSSLWLLASSVL